MCVCVCVCVFISLDRALTNLTSSKAVFQALASLANLAAAQILFLRSTGKQSSREGRLVSSRSNARRGCVCQAFLLLWSRAAGITQVTLRRAFDGLLKGSKYLVVCVSIMCVSIYSRSYVLSPFPITAASLVGWRMETSDTNLSTFVC